MGFLELSLSLLALSQVTAYPSSYERKYQCQVPQVGQTIMNSPATEGSAIIALSQNNVEVYEYTPGETYTLQIRYPEPAKGFVMTSSGTFYGPSATHRAGCGNQKITSDVSVWSYTTSWIAPESTQARITVAYASRYGMVFLNTANILKAADTDTSVSNCVDDMLECPQLKNYCAFVGPFCSATCGLCDVVDAAPCVDVATVPGSNNMQYTCDQLISLCSHPTYGAYVSDQCPVTCGVCEGEEIIEEIVPAEPVTTDVYLGHGCFWETQYHFINLELTNSLRPCIGQYGDARCKSTGSFDRDLAGVTSLSGYAGGNYPGETACYMGNYNHIPMGHTEVVGVTLDGSPDSVTAQEQFSKLIDLYFEGFIWTPMGMQRPDPMDKGRGYRSAIGIPGGVNSPLYPLVEAANKYGMSLIPGDGSEDDVINVAYVHDSNVFPFFPAEAYHQYHSDFKGTPFPKSYVNTMYQEKFNMGHLPDTPQCAPGSHW